MSGHTPGPWEVVGGDSRLEIYGAGAPIASVGTVPYWDRFAETDAANAELMAAAPALLAERDALRALNAELAACLQYIGENLTNSDSVYLDDAREKISAALAKVKP